ncbi:MAG TPA: NapC/NirT family cytochrome c [Thermoanaerobaculia bacterium]|nr:NapC/NirT family cytochrome c [Thermoanaerobaculia bacterium]
MKTWLRPLVYLGQNPLSILGAVLTTSSAFTLIAFWIFELLQAKPIHPYAGIVFFLILPGIFLAGLVLIPIGLIVRRRALVRAGLLPREYPRIDFHQPILRRAFVLVGVATFLNFLILGTASYLGVEYMDSTQFCGQTCHTVMQPEYAAYRDSPHSRVECVECHIGAGAPWFVRAKISGVRQVFAVALHTYSTPIPSPVEHLRPARETCERCHWPQRFVGDRLVVRTKFTDDENNTKQQTVLLVKVGGGRTGVEGTGIHGRHLDHGSRVSYVATDTHRQVIPVVWYVDDSGKTVEYVSTDVKTTPEQLARGEHRTMDCMDCHNRPSHTFELPERAVDEAMAAGTISATLPFVKKETVALLRASYPDQQTATSKISEGLVDFYRTKYPPVYAAHRAQIEAAADRAGAIYRRNVFPAMKVGWGTYPNNLGHEDFLGCFRCHDGSHASKDGKVITQDCDACHAVLAQEETNPKILTDLGLK